MFRLVCSRSVGWSVSLALVFILQVRAAAFVEIGQNFTGSTFGVDSDAQPPDASGAIGLSHFVEFINGRFSVYDKTTGRRVQTMTDLSFWASAGVTIPSTLIVTDPRIVFDVYSQRWFASMVDASANSTRQSRNRFLLAVSASSDPTGNWSGFAFTADPVHGDFADFPTLGLDRDGVYLSGDMFTTSGISIGPSLISIPKSVLLDSPPNISGRTSFGILAYNARGNILQPAVTTGSASSGESVLAVGNLGYDFNSHNTLYLSTIQNGASTSATLPSSTVLTITPYVGPSSPTQPDGSNNLDSSDARLSASVRRVGDTLYAVHCVEVDNRAAVRWYKLDAVNMALLQSDTITDPTLDLFYPSIAANEAGTVVIGCNGCSGSTYVGCYAVVGEMVNGTLTFGDLVLLKSGAASYQSPDVTGNSRWGDYSSTTVDPQDPSRFWTMQAYPSRRNRWATQITEIITAPTVRMTVVNSGANLMISWPASATGFQLQSSASILPTASWSPVVTSPVVSGDRLTVILPTSELQGFYRLTQ